MLDIPAAKNLALFSLFVWRSAFDKAALTLAFAAAAIAAVRSAIFQAYSEQENENFKTLFKETVIVVIGNIYMPRPQRKDTQGNSLLPPNVRHFANAVALPGTGQGTNHGNIVI